MRLIRIAFTLLLLSQFSVALAEKMDLPTYGLVMAKLERALSKMEKSNSSRFPVMVRLADLYAERARIKEMQEVEKNCKGCLKSRDDRKQALTYYNKVFRARTDIDKGPIALQMAHLHQILGETSKAISLYKTIISNQREYGKELAIQSHLGLGDIYFQQGKFKSALGHFRSVEATNSAQKGYAVYRSGWCYLNLGQTNQAVAKLIKILKTPELLQQPTSSGVDIDESFHQEVARDLATFLARKNLSTADVEQLYQLTPHSDKLNNIFYLATELDRLGHRRSARVAWAFYLSHEQDAFKRLQAQVHLTGIHYQAGRQKAAVKEMEQAVKSWQKHGCSPQQECQELKQRLRKLVVDWNHANKNDPTRYLNQAYAQYNDLFPNDLEMHLWAADVARQVEDRPKAIAFYNKASLIAAEQLKSKDKPKVRKAFEGALLGQVEVAEETKQAKLRLKAYEHYLALNPNGTKSFEIRYQKAHVLYEAKQYQKAADLFYSLAIGGHKSEPKLGKKSADLALDAMAILKNNDVIEKWANEFAGVYRAHQREFGTIARKAVLNHAAKVVSSKNSKKNDYKNTLDRLKRLSLKGADRNDQLSYYKSQLILAENLKLLNEVKRAANGLLRVKNLAQPDRDLAMGKKAWVAEMQLDFKTAYRINRKLRHQNLSAEQRHLKLALLAELAGLSPTKHYEQALSSSKSIKQANLIRAKMALTSKRPWKVIKSEMSHLRKTPDVLASVALEAFARHENFANAQKVLTANKRVADYQEGATLARLIFNRWYQPLVKKIKRHKIRMTSDYILQKSLEKRIDLLSQVDKSANEAIQSGDWILQVLTLEDIRRENNRLYREILALPVPRRLKAEQLDQYKSAILKQAQPYLAKSQQAEKKLDEFWDDDRSIKNLISFYVASSPLVKKTVKRQIRQAANIASFWTKRKLVNALEKNSRPSPRIIAEARKQLEKSPFSTSATAKLMKLERQQGRDVMVTYLDQRLDLLKESR